MTDLVVYTNPSVHEWDQLLQTSKMVAETEFAPKAVRGNPDAVMACLLTGRELGIGPMQALRDVYIVNGRPSLSATFMVSRVRALGHQFKTLESTETRAVVQIHRKGEPEPEPPVTFTIDQAKRAGLAGKDVWKSYPERMLWARAASAACRRDAPEALGGVVYTPEEIESIPEDGPATTVTWGEPEASEAAVPPHDPAAASDSPTTAEAVADLKRDVAAAVEAPAAGGNPEAPAAGELTPAELLAWLVEDLPEDGITEAKVKSTLSKVFTFVRTEPWPASLARIPDLERARALLHERYGSQEGE